MSTQPVKTSAEGTIENLVIIGSGPAGLTAGIYASRANLNPLIIEGTSPGGQLMGTTHVENWPGEKSILGPELMMNIRDHAKHFGTRFMSREIVKADLSTKPFTLTTNKNQEIKTHALIIATGSTPRRLNVPGESEYWGKGVTTCAVCDGAFYPGKQVIIVGGGDTAMEDASFMTKFTDKITLVHILDKLTASYPLQQRVLADPRIKIIYNSSVSLIEGDGSHVTHATITNQKTGTQEKVETGAVFIAIGLTPNSAPFQGQLKLNNYGYIEKTDSVLTSVPGVFVAGDVADFKYRQAIASAGTGCMAALEAERYLHKIL